MDLVPLWISLKTACTAIVLSFAAGVLLARWRLANRSRWMEVADGLFTLPVALPPTVVGLALLIFFGSHSPIGFVLIHIGIHIVFSWPATVVAAFVVSFPIVYQTSKAAFSQIDRNLLDVARTFGYGEWQILWRLMIPLAWPGVATGVALGFLRALGEFGATWMIAGNIPGRTQTAAMAIYSAAETGDWAEPLLLSVLLTLIAIGVIFLVNHWSKQHAEAR